jgi:hypothetical protein
MDQQEYIETRLDDQIDWYDKKSQWNQKWYKWLRIFEIVAASAIPLLTGFINQQENSWHIVVGTLGALIAAFSGITALYKFHELWIEYRTVAETLRHHKFLFLTKSQPYHEENSFTLLVDTVEGVISKENSNWSSFNKRKEKEKANG